MILGHQISELKIYIFIESVDMRKQVNGLLLLIESAFKLDPYERLYSSFTIKVKIKSKLCVGMKNEISKFRDAIIYSVNQEISLRNFVLDGRLECSNNKSEISIKTFVIARKNFLFCNKPSGADASAITFSLVETAKENNLNIFKYLEYILDRMSQDNNYDIEKLMPWSDEIPEECRAR